MLSLLKWLLRRSKTWCVNINRIFKFPGGFSILRVSPELGTSVWQLGNFTIAFVPAVGSRDSSLTDLPPCIGQPSPLLSQGPESIHSEELHALKKPYPTTRYHSNGPWPTVENEANWKKRQCWGHRTGIDCMLNASSQVDISTFIAELQICATSSAQITTALRY